MLNFHNNLKVQESIAKIKSALPDKDVYNGQLFQNIFQQEISFDFARKSLKRVNVKNVSFQQTSFEAAAGTGSKFTETFFHNCNFTGANFQDCYFNKCTFDKNTIIKGANFNNSIFIDCHFDKISIWQSTLFNCHFENCSFISCEIYSDTTENSLLYNCYIENIDLAHINLEYMQIENTTMENTKLPPYQVAYIIGAPLYIKNTVDNVSIYSDNGDVKRADYNMLYEDLAFYYYSLQEYFPLSNILIALEQHEQALEYIKLGIQEACDYFDFRMIKHYCRLACSNNYYSSLQLKEIYNQITNLSYNNTWDLNTLHSYMINIGSIRELLLNHTNENKQLIEFRIKTNIDKDNLKAINELYNQINILIKNNCSEQHIDCIELRHNSPYELFVTCIDSLPYILTFISSLYGLLMVGNKFLDIYKNIEETKRIWQQNHLYHYEVEEKKLDIQLKQLELEEKQKKQKSSLIYTVTEIEHNIKCNTVDAAKAIKPDILHYKYQKEEYPEV